VRQTRLISRRAGGGDRTDDLVRVLAGFYQGVKAGNNGNAGAHARHLPDRVERCVFIFRRYMGSGGFRQLLNHRAEAVTTAQAQDFPSLEG